MYVWQSRHVKRFLHNTGQCVPATRRNNMFFHSPTSPTIAPATPNGFRIPLWRTVVKFWNMFVATRFTTIFSTKSWFFYLWSCMPNGGPFRAQEVICKTLHAQTIRENVKAKVKPARQWRVRFGAQGQMWEETAISIPTANCINSSIDCSRKAPLRTATFCQLSRRFHLANSSIFVTHVFGLLPHFSHAVAILMLVSPKDWVEGNNGQWWKVNPVCPVGQHFSNTAQICETDIIFKLHHGFFAPNK